MLYSFAFILDPRAKLRGMQRVLHLLHECSGTDYTAYYGDVKTELHKLFEKYLRKYGASRNQRVAGPTPVTGKRKQAWGEFLEDQIYLVLQLPVLLLNLLLLNLQAIWTATA